MDLLTPPPPTHDDVLRAWMQPQPSIERPAWTAVTSLHAADAWTGDVAMIPDGDHSSELVLVVTKIQGGRLAFEPQKPRSTRF